MSADSEPQKLRAVRMILEAKSQKSKAIDLREMNLKSLPPPLFECVTLNRVLLSKNMLTALPAGFANLIDLIDLDLSNNAFTEVPAALFGLSNLRRLSMRGNRLESVPDGIAGLDHLQRLDLSHNKINTLPPTNIIHKLTSLEVLSLANNSISGFPNISGLPRLNYLDVSSNAIAFIPSTLAGQLSRIQRLNISKNSIQTVPGELARNKGLVCDEGIRFDGRKTQLQPSINIKEKEKGKEGEAGKAAATSESPVSASHSGYIAPNESDREFTAGSISTVHIRLRDGSKVGVANAMKLIEAKLEMEASNPNAASASIVPKIEEDSKPGRYLLLFKPKIAGVLQIAVSVGGVPIKGSPMPCLVRAGNPSPQMCKVMGTGLSGCVAGEESKVIVHLRDMFGNMCNSYSHAHSTTPTPISLKASLAMPSGSDSDLIHATVKTRDLRDGRYIVAWAAKNAGEWTLRIQLNSTELHASPFTIQCRHAKIHPPSCFLVPGNQNASVSEKEKVLALKAGSEKRGRAYSIVLRDRFGNVCLGKNCVGCEHDVTESIVVASHSSSTTVALKKTVLTLKKSHNGESEGEDEGEREGEGVVVQISLQHIDGSPFPINARSDVNIGSDGQTSQKDQKLECSIDGCNPGSPLKARVGVESVLPVSLQTSNGKPFVIPIDLVSETLSVVMKSAACKIEAMPVLSEKTIVAAKQGKYDFSYTLPLAGVFTLQVSVSSPSSSTTTGTVLYSSSVQCDGSAVDITSPAVCRSVGPEPHIRCKCYVQDDTGAFGFVSGACKIVTVSRQITLDTFKSRICSVLDVPRVYIQYQDEDDDLVDIISQCDLEEAMDWAIEAGAGRMKLVVSPAAAEVVSGDGDVFLPVPGTRYAIPGSPGVTKTVYIRQPSSNSRPTAHSPFSSSNAHTPQTQQQRGLHLSPRSAHTPRSAPNPNIVSSRRFRLDSRGGHQLGSSSSPLRSPAPALSQGQGYGHGQGYRMRLKCILDDDVRIVDIPKRYMLHPDATQDQDADLDYNDVLMRVQSEYGCRVNMRYRDLDDDLVTITSIGSLLDAENASVTSGSPYVRLFLTARSKDENDDMNEYQTQQRVPMSMPMSQSHSPMSRGLLMPKNKERARSLFSPQLLSRVNSEYASGVASLRRASYGNGRARSHRQKDDSDKLIGGRFKIIEENSNENVVREGVVVILKGQDTLSGKEVAVRVFHDADVMSNELAVLESLQGREQIVKLIHSTHQELHAIIVDCGGGVGRTLSSHLPLRTHSANENDARFIGNCIASGLAHMHANGIVHASLSPLVIHRAPEENKWKIGGLSKARGVDSDSAVAVSATAVSKSNYSSPEELLDSDQSPSCSTDCWRLGAILYEILVGRPLFPDDTTAFNTLSRIIKSRPNSSTLPDTLLGLSAIANDQARDLVSQLLSIEPKRRATATNALKHPFLSASTQSHVDVDPVRTRQQRIEAMRAKVSRDQTQNEVEAIRGLLSKMAVSNH